MDDTASLTLPTLPTDLSICHAMIAQLVDQLQKSHRAIGQLEHQLQQLLRRMYGRSSETLDPSQMALFTEVLQQLQAAQPPAMEPVAKSAIATPSAVTGHGRRRLPADLPRVRIEHDLPEAQKPCPCCGKLRKCIGEEVSEQLEYVPAKVTVLQHVRLKYACAVCEQNAQSPQITTADKPLGPIDKGLAGPGLLAYVIVSKYGDHLPLHRIERILGRHDIDVARSTMCDWAAQSAQALRPLYELMVKEVVASRVIHTDDTPVDVLDRKLKQTRTGRFWVYLGDKTHPFNVFTYTRNRTRDGPMNFLRGWGKERRVYLQADAFGGYDGIYAAKAGGGVTEVACWAHARRKFFDARTSDVSRSTAALAHIRLLYDVEDQARELAPDQRATLRQQLATPRLLQFKHWLEQQQAIRGGDVLPKSPMGQAITYALNQWDALSVYVTDGDLAIDNNPSENALRRVALGRKNWLFCGSDAGGDTAAILFTFIATCQRRNVEPFAYLRDTLTRIAEHPLCRLAELLPGATSTSLVTHGLD